MPRSSDSCANHDPLLDTVASQHAHAKSSVHGLAWLLLTRVYGVARVRYAKVAKASM